MTKTIACIALASTLAAGCTSSTAFGPCVGIAADRDPGLTYKVNTWNVIVGVVLLASIIVPAVVLFDEVTCPIARKAAAK